MTRHTLVRLLPWVACLASVAGCGGGGAPTRVASRAAVRFGVTWPTVDRAAGSAVESVLVSVEVGGQEVGRKIVDRLQDAGQTQTETTFDGLPAGEMRARGVAYSQTGGQGEEVGSGADAGPLRSGDTVYESVALPTEGGTGLTVTKSPTGNLVVGVR